MTRSLNYETAINQSEQTKMKRVLTTEKFDEWLENLRDLKAKAKIEVRIQRAKNGNFGDCKRIVGGNIWELRIAHGSDYRIYFGKSGSKIIVLLAGGDKGSQLRDIERAKKYWLDFLGE